MRISFYTFMIIYDNDNVLQKTNKLVRKTFLNSNKSIKSYWEQSFFIKNKMRNLCTRELNVMLAIHYL